MKIYFAGSPAHDVVVHNNARRLVSFADKQAILKYWEVSNDTPIFLDSGAFTAFTQGKQVDIDEYIAFIKQNTHRIEAYAALDVINDSVATNKNLAYMQEKGLTPIPVFQFEAPLEELEQMVQKYEYIALGGLVPHAMNRKLLQWWLDNCFAIIKDRCKVHGFGVNARWAWERYPFYSVDATSWLSGSKFGRMEFEGKNHTKGSNSVLAMKFHTAHWKELADYGLKDYKRKAELITRLWESRGVIWK